MATLRPWTHAALRVAAGILFMQHGAQKLLGWLGGLNGSGATAPFASQFGVAGVLELAGGLLLLLGLFARPVAFVLMLEMLVAYGKAHLPLGGWPIQNQGELALLYAAIFLFFVGHGAGPFSVDALVLIGQHRDRRRLPHDRRVHATA